MGTKHSHLFTRILAALVLISLLAFGGIGRVSAGSIIYVRAGGAGRRNGSSWANAYGSLQRALTVAVSGQQIWVAEGTYTPVPGTNRAISFHLKNGVAVYGGFAGTETLLSQRRPWLNPTILSGDIGVAGSASDNSYHVVVASGVSSTSILDGFRIRGGKANGAAPNNRGAGLYNVGGSPTLRNLLFSGNSSSALGGGMFSSLGAPVLERVIFSSNVAGTAGGGLYNLSGTPHLRNVIFNANSASTSGVGSGGALYNHGGAGTINDVTFSNNFAADAGGAVFNGNGSTARFVNVTFSGNTANSTGGGMNNNASSPTLINVTFDNNSGGDAGGSMYNAAKSSPHAYNSIFWSGDVADDGTGAPAVSYSVMLDGCTAGITLTCGHILTGDPMLGPLQNNGGFTKTMALGAGSSAINTAFGSLCPPLDQRGVIRPQGGACDDGAYELQFGP